MSISKDNEIDLKFTREHGNVLEWISTLGSRS